MARLPVLYLGALLLIGCGEGGEQTERIELDTFAVGVGGTSPIVNEPPAGVDPWTVTLHRADVVLGPVYLFEGEPLITRLWHRISPLGVAHAHPGHYQEGEALGEMLDQAVVDLLDPEPALLGAMSAVTGPCASARLGIGTADSALAGADLMEGHAVIVAGSAQQEGGAEVPFQAFLDLDTYVEGLTFDQELDSAPGRVVIDVDLSRWLRRIDFASAASDGEGAATFEPESQGHNAFSRGVDNTLAYTLRWEGQGDGVQ